MEEVLLFPIRVFNLLLCHFNLNMVFILRYIASADRAFRHRWGSLHVL